MTKRFIVLIEASSAEQNVAFREYIKGTRMGWWHWMANAWLLVDPKGVVNAAQIRDKVVQIFPGMDTLVIEMREEGGTWAGFGPRTDERNMFNWLRTNWK